MADFAFYVLAGWKYKIQDLTLMTDDMPFVGSASGRGELGLPALKPARPMSNRYWLYASTNGVF